MTKKCKDGYAHHWIIATAAGPESKGQCVHCAGVKVFQNSISGEELRHINISEKPRYREWPGYISYSLGGATLNDLREVRSPSHSLSELFMTQAPTILF